MNYICRIWKIAAIRGAVPTLHPQFIYRFTKLYSEERTSGKYLEAIAKKVLSDALEERKTDSSNGMSFGYDNTKQKVLIDRLLDLEEKGLMDRRRILDQIINFIITVSEAEIEC